MKLHRNDCKLCIYNTQILSHSLSLSQLYFFDLLLDLVADLVLFAEVVAGLLAGVVSSEEPASERYFLLAALSPRVTFDVDGDGVGVAV